MSEALSVLIRRLPHGEDLPLPSYATVGAAGLDLIAALPVNAPETLQPMQRKLIACGIAIALPEGYEAQIRPRSGLAAKHGITLVNAPGTIDWDYRGELKTLLINLGTEAFTVERGMRIAQLVVAPVTRIVWQEQSELGETERGAGGYGSTGTHMPGAR
jgi:dUTP pyrophosphatase